jgi:hypothetical protein
MNTTEPERKPGTQTENKHRSEPPWNVIWHNEWENPLRWVTLGLRKVIVGITLERATKTAWERTTKAGQWSGDAAESCRIYNNFLQGEGLIVSLEPARQTRVREAASSP